MAAAPAPDLIDGSEDQEIAQRMAKLPLPFEVLLHGLSDPRPAPPLLIEIADDGTTNEGVEEDVTKQGIATVYTKLSLPSAGLSDISWIKRYKFIQTLQLPGNGISAIEPLSHLPFLTTLDLSNNRLTTVLEDIHPVPPSKAIPTFFSVDLSRNQIQRIGDLSRHKYLERLSLEKNLIMGIDGLEGCRYLTELRLGHNGISKITGLDHLPLKILDLRWNRLTSLTGLSHLPNLTHLYLSNNAVSHLSDLDGCHNANPQLSLVDLGYNLISDVSELAIFAESKMLRELVLRGNPVAGMQGSDKDMDEGQTHLGTPVQSRSRSQSRGPKEGGKSGHSRLPSVGAGASTISPTTRGRGSPINTSAPSGGSDVYRLSAVFALPRLTSLDHIRVTAEDKVAALNHFDPPAEVRASVDHSRLMAKQAKLYARVKHVDLVRATGRLRPIVLCGPSGVGKRTLAQRLVVEFPHVFGLAVSHTTRRARPGEENGVHYHFVDRVEMDEMARDGAFVEIVNLFGNSYGTSVDGVDRVAEEGKVCVMSLEIEGVVALRRSQLHPRYVYVTTSTITAIGARLQNRQQASHSASSAGRVRSAGPDREELLEGVPPLPGEEDGRGDVEVEVDVEEEIRRWTEKAERTAVDAEGLGPNFFDLILVNDDLEQAYANLRDFALKVGSPSAYEEDDTAVEGSWEGFLGVEEGSVRETYTA